MSSQNSIRKKHQEARLTLKMNELHSKGVINDQTLLMFGISGDLPDVSSYNRLTTEEKSTIWNEKLANRFGNNWREDFNRKAIPLITVRRLKASNADLDKINWRKEGF